MPSLAELKGKKIIVQLVTPLLEAKHNILITHLIDTEDAGLWIEGTDLAEVLQGIAKKPLERTPLFFVPFSQIVWIFSHADYPYLSEKSLGVKTP